MLEKSNPEILKISFYDYLHVLKILIFWRHDNLHNDIQHNDIYHNDIQDKITHHNDIQHNNKNFDIKHNGIQCLCRVSLFSVSVF
jgi:hypothetical protein